ncbi:glycine oxidase ThiO [Pseudomonas subflava]|uniref:glycine oxidase ThiO n=1 Tax=Pseudomonas subflava TaxID=2952933 RepID=UPI00207AE16E|nr:glycine oxidase ThiO [Pseudomonas subflava]
MKDIVVVGAGALGLLSALSLAQDGCSVLLLEAAQVGREASWAGGGIISPLYPWRYGLAVTALAHWSQDFYPRFGEALFAKSGINPEVYVTGLYWLDLEDQAKALAWAVRHQQELYLVEKEKVCRHVPALDTSFKQAVCMSNVANIRNPHFVKALRAVLDRMPNVEIREQSPVSGFLRSGEKVCGVIGAWGVAKARRTVVAAGAWSGSLLKTLCLELPVEPVKGQMILYKCAEDFLPAMVLAKGRYAIPRKDGHILVGSTLEHVGFDKTPTEEALASLKASAEELLPALAEAEVIGHWAGLRPGSPDGIPFIGEVPQYPGLWLNCGHYRNGLVLAPASCELLKNLMLGETPIVDPTPYSPAGRLGTL